MSNFWERALGGGQPAPQPPPQQPAQRPWWQEQAPPPPQPQQAVHGGYAAPPPPQQPQLAVQNYRQADDALADHIANNGYMQVPPQWVQHQPTDRCPNCQSVNYGQISGAGPNGQYGGLVTIGGKGTSQQAIEFKRCFDCGYTPYRGLSDSQVANQTRLKQQGATAATRQVPSGGGVVNNFHPKSEKPIATI
jgi:hypothetical protein